jgi:hypothetical protein
MDRLSSRKAPPSRKKKDRRRLAAALVIILIVIAAVLFLFLHGGITNIISPPSHSKTTTGPGAVGITVNVALHTTPSGRIQRLNVLTKKAVQLDLSADASGSSPFTYLWKFGDGTNSTSQQVNQVFAPDCVYDIELKTTNNAGQADKAELLFSIFPSNSTGGAVDICPQQGTAGITNVELAGAWFKSNESVWSLADGQRVASTSTDTKGSWSIDITNDLQPEVNGSLYKLTTLPSSLTRTFLTLEGIEASPHSGEPGTSFTLEGRSYPANTQVTIYLGGTRLGTAQTDDNGTFSARLQIPSSFRYAGVYQFTTSPPVLGASATFTIPVSTTTPPQPVPNNWWYLLIPLVAIPALIGLYLWRRKPLVELEVFQEEMTMPFRSSWAIRVWSSKRLNKCGVMYGNAPIRAAISPTDARIEVTLVKGSVDFRIPNTLPIDQDALVVVRAKGKILASERFGSIPRTNPQGDRSGRR